MSTQVQQAKPQQQATAPVAVLERNIVDTVAQRIMELQKGGQIKFPRNYSPENALKAAWLAVQEAKDSKGQPALNVCTKTSIANALLNMVVQGLNPAKNQCYFVVYGNQLVCMRSYFGSMAVVQNYVVPGGRIWHGVVYDGDEFEFELRHGLRVPTVHKQKLQNIKPDKIVAAYCVIEDRGGNIVGSEIMTMDEIRRLWEQYSRTYKPGGTSFHNTTPDQAAIRTVVNRACKFVINRSDDSYLADLISRIDDEASEAEIEEEIALNANREEIDVAPASIHDGPIVEAEIVSVNGNGNDHAHDAQEPAATDGADDLEAPPADGSAMQKAMFAEASSAPDGPAF